MRVIHPRNSERSQEAFTATELLVVIGCLALLVLTVLPVMAGGWEKASRFQCANNLRQLHVASIQHANNSNGWFPLWTHPAGGINQMRGAWYSRYVWLGNPDVHIPPSLDAAGGQFQNAGYLYGAGLIGEGSALFCPSLEGTPRGSLLGSEHHKPLITSDASGAVRSSYQYNPRVTHPNSTNLRRYQKTSDLEPHKLFIVDYVGLIGEWVTHHESERGWNVLFTDGSVQFSTSESVYTLVSRGLPREYDAITLERLFDFLEEEP